MAFTMRMSARRCPVGFGGMGHGQNDEEEPVEPPPAGNGVLVVTTHCEYPSIPNGAAHDGFAVMVQVKAPTLFFLGVTGGEDPHQFYFWSLFGGSLNHEGSAAFTWKEKKYYLQLLHWRLHIGTKNRTPGLGHALVLLR